MARVLDNNLKRFDVNDNVGGRKMDFQGVPFTLSCWVNPAVVGVLNVYIGGININVAANGWEWGIGQTVDKFGLYTDNGAWANFDNGPGIGSWQHVAVTQSMTTRIAFLDWDGATGKSTPIAKGPPTDGAARDKTIGARHDATNTASASMAECAAWDRVLTDLELQDLASGKSPAFIPSGLVFYAKLDEASGIPVDSGPHGMAITEVGGPIASAAHPAIIYPSIDDGLSARQRRRRLIMGLTS